MELNEGKSKYIIFNRAQADFNTRLIMNNTNLDKLHEVRLLVVLLTDDLSFERNTQDICRRAFARISILTELKFVGVPLNDLIQVYIFLCSQFTIVLLCQLVLLTNTSTVREHRESTTYSNESYYGEPLH